MAEHQIILNLDEMLAAEPERVIVFGGQSHRVSGLTGRVYLQFLQLRKKIELAEKDSQDDAQFQYNFEIIGLVAPSLHAQLEAMKDLKLTVLQKLVEFVTEDFKTRPGEDSDSKQGES